MQKNDSARRKQVLERSHRKYKSRTNKSTKNVKQVIKQQK